MIDLHCHILPGVDDGAGSMADAVRMAHLAALSGVQTIVATPHCNLPGRKENFAGEELSERVRQLNRAVREQGIPVKILPGCEVFCTDELAKLLHRRKLQSLADSKYLLMEFYFDESPEFMDRCFRSAVEAGYVPVVAHPERYEAVYRDAQLVPRWFREGYVIQLNKGSILGRLGAHAETVADWLLRQGFAHAVASDAHSPQHRTPHMDEVAAHLEALCGQRYTHILLQGNPERIITDRMLIKP